MTARTVELQCSPADAWARVQAAAATVGKVEETSELSRYLLVKARYGLNPVRLRVSVLSAPTAEAAVLEIAGRGQDVWGVASRRVIDQLIQALG